MNRRVSALSPAILLWAAAAGALAQEDHSHAHGTESLGKVRFETSCRRDVAAEFTRATALLHSFGYEESRRAFDAVAAKDPSCGMAYWGIAMTYYHQIWAPPTPAELAGGSAAAAKARELSAKTDRERGYIGAVSAFYEGADSRDHRARAAAYRDAMEALSKRFPDDHDAAIFYALSLLATAPPSDAKYANQRKAAAILNGLLPAEPEHPGIAHYMIHAFDYPALAQDALPAARAYAKIAPSSPHALHMPSHIFTRLGLWQESIASNIDAAEAGRRLMAVRNPGAASYETLHALDYLEYAYLQMGDDARAKRVLDETAGSKTFDQGTFQVGFAVAAVPARWTLERRDWAAAAALEPPAVSLDWDRFAYAPAATEFARAIGAARSGDAARARQALDSIERIHARLAKSPVPGPYDWASHVESLRLAAAAWVDWAQGRKDGALELARAAAELDEKTGKHSVTPGSMLPPRELLGDMLLEAGRPADALVAYDAALREAPNRFNGLYGAARAAELSGDPARARELYAKLVAQCVADSSRAELAAARRYLGQVAE